LLVTNFYALLLTETGAARLELRPVHTRW
jgi:hypothetical protein